MNKVKAAIISILGVLVIAGVGIACYCLFPAVKATIQNEKYYTQKDVQDSYDNGYYDGCKNGEELTGQVDYYKKLVDEYYINVNTLNGEIATLNAQKMDYERRVESLTELKTQNEQTIADLQDTVKANDETINELNTQIMTLQREISSLETTGENNAQQIELLQNQVATLQSLSAQLQATNAMNVETITSLNNQVANLNNQISEMSNLTQSSSSQILALNNKINELQKSVDYYETYIAQLESGERVVATFEFNGSVYDIQIVNKDSKLTVTDPVNTESIIFNGWTVDGELVDLSVYTITQNTKFVADVSYLNEIKFMVDDELHATKYAANNATVTLPETPIKDGYDFDGWSINGVDVVEDVENIAVVENTTYIAVFTKLHTVTFMYEDTVLEMQNVRNGEFAMAPIVEDLPIKIFNGWLLNDSSVDVETYEVLSSVVFVADITYKYKVDFMSGDEVVETQYLLQDTYANISISPTKAGYDFSGWSLDGENVINLSTKKIIADTTFYAVYMKCDFVKVTYSVERLLFNSFYADCIWSYGGKTYYSNGADQYYLDEETNTWRVQVWSGGNKPNGRNVRVIKDKLYYCGSDANGNSVFYNWDAENLKWVLFSSKFNMSDYSVVRGNKYYVFFDYAVDIYDVDTLEQISYDYFKVDGSVYSGTVSIVKDVVYVGKYIYDFETETLTEHLDFNPGHIVCLGGACYSFNSTFGSFYKMDQETFVKEGVAADFIVEGLGVKSSGFYKYNLYTNSDGKICYATSLDVMYEYVGVA